MRSGQGRGLLCAHGSCIVRPVELGHKGARSADRAACSSPVGHGSRGWSRARQSAEQPCAHAASASMATAAASPPCRRRAAACVCVHRRAQQSVTNDKADIGSYETPVTSIQTLLLLRNSSPKAFQRYLTRLLTLGSQGKPIYISPASAVRSTLTVERCTKVAVLRSYALTEARHSSFRLRFVIKIMYLRGSEQPPARRRRRSERSGTPFRPAPFGTFQGNGQLSTRGRTRNGLHSLARTQPRVLRKSTLRPKVGVATERSWLRPPSCLFLPPCIF